MIIGLTGMSGSGKSTVSEILQSFKFNVIDCDKKAQQVIRSEKCEQSVKVVFPEIYVDGQFDRKKAAEFLFSDPEKLVQYQKIVFPYIVYDVLNTIKEIKESSPKFPIVLDAATLFQSKADDFCDKIIAVVADKKTCLDRIIKRDNITEKAALMRLHNQPDEKFFCAKADYTIKNNSTLEELEKQVLKVCLLKGQG